MKITGVSVFCYELAYVHGTYAMSGGRSQAQKPSLVVRIRTDEGLVGWGETCPHGRTYLPAFFEGELAAFAILGQAVLGHDPRELGLIQSAMQGALLGGMAAKSAIDIACWDLLGRAIGLPIFTLLGGPSQATVRVWESVPIMAADEMVRHVETARAVGVTAFQIKVGTDPYVDAARLKAVLTAVDTDTLVVADANGGWSLQDALIATRQMAGFHIYLEQPCRSLVNCAEVRRHTTHPMILDECIDGVDGLFAARAAVGAGGVNVKPSRLGGLTPARLLRDTATELGMTVTIDDPWGGALTTAALSHLAVSTQAAAFLATSFFSEWVTPLVADGPRRQPNGRGSAPPGPGLGVRVHEAMLGTPVIQVQ